MNNFILTIVACCAVSFSSWAQHLTQTITFASKKQATELLQQPDDFTNAWSAFDLEARTSKKGATPKELFKLINKHVLDWSKNEKAQIEEILSDLDTQLVQQKMKFDLPQEVVFIKTTGKEEGGAAGYTRGQYVVLSQKLLAKPTYQIKKVIVHELFHVMSRNNPEFRQHMYALIGFTLCAPIALPDSLQHIKITNPDAPTIDSYITLTINQKEERCAMLLYAHSPYNGGPFFNYVKVGLIQLTAQGQPQVALINGQPAIYKLADASNFFDQVGNNTQYVIHPEEILADNFTIAVLGDQEVPNPELIANIEQLLQTK